MFRAWPYLLGIVLLCGYSAVVGPQLETKLPEILAAPERFAGHELTLDVDAEVLDVYPMSFRIEHRDTTVLVQVPKDVADSWHTWHTDLQPGDFVSVKTEIHSDGYLVLHDLHVHKGRTLKMWVSVFALFVLAGLVMGDRSRIF